MNRCSYNADLHTSKAKAKHSIAVSEKTMKTTALISFSFLLFAFTTAEFVYDSDGELLKNGGKYYISPPTGGGVTTIAAIWGQPVCSLAVVQSLSYSAWPFVIASPYLTLHITTNFPLYISLAYVAPNVCTNSSQWVVAESSTVGLPVMVGDLTKDHNPNGDAIVRGWFKIKPYKNGYYKLVFLSSDNPDDVKNIGVHVDNDNNKRLVVTDKEPLPVKFVKVEEKSASHVLMVV